MNTLNKTVKMGRFFSLAAVVSFSITSRNTYESDSPATSTTLSTHNNC
ncbi:MAG: hypothetical protein ACI9EQ_002503 [Bacteroidia bacterium]|jgi:hypothetical protein